MEPQDRISEIEEELRAIETRRHRLLTEMQKLRRELEIPKLPLTAGVPRSSDEKVSLFLTLFGARRAVYPRLWENPKTGRKGYSPVCRNEWVRGVCEKPHVKCTDCPHQDFPPLDHSAILAHLTGQLTAGTYAICEDDSCIFLAADFDGEGWAEDVAAYRRAGEELGLCIAVERSRSGNGAHAWIFFVQPVAAALARRLGTLIGTIAKPLMDQWNDRLQKFLGLSKREIHILGQSRHREAPVALGMLQTLARAESPAALLGNYAQVIIDECHHVPAASFEAAMKQCAARYILGLTATPTRKDGLQKILFLQCGAIRHRISLDHAENQSRSVVVREFAMRLPPENDRLPIHQLWALLIQSGERNRAIVADVVAA